MPFFFLALVSLFHACRQCLPATCPKLLLSSWIGINSAGLLTNMEAESKSVTSEKMWLSDFQESLGRWPWILPLPNLPRASVRESPPGAGVWRHRLPRQVSCSCRLPGCCFRSEFPRGIVDLSRKGTIYTKALFSVLSPNPVDQDHVFVTSTGYVIKFWSLPLRQCHPMFFFFFNAIIMWNETLAGRQDTGYLAYYKGPVATRKPVLLHRQEDPISSSKVSLLNWDSFWVWHYIYGVRALQDTPDDSWELFQFVLGSLTNIHVNVQVSYPPEVLFYISDRTLFSRFSARASS